MPTEFDDSTCYGCFMTGTTLNASTGKFVRQSELTLAALRAAGVLDNMEDGFTPPNNQDNLWLDKNTDPAVLKKYNYSTSAWEPVEYKTFFGGDSAGIEDVFVGDGIETDFELKVSPFNPEDISVYVGGAIQTASDYSLSGRILTISPPVADGVQILVKTIAKTVPIAATSVSRDKLVSSLNSAIARHVKEFGAVGDGVADDTIAIRNAIASGLSINLGDSTYLISGSLTLPSGFTLMGCGATLKTISAITMVVPKGEGGRVTGIKFLGSGKDSGLSQVGVYIDGTRVVGGVDQNDAVSRWTVDHCYFEGLRDGVMVTRIVDSHQGNTISSCIAKSCFRGFYAASRGEYSIFSGVSASLCTVGIQIRGGNTCVTGSVFSDNDTGIQLEAGSNDAHGTVTGCLVNHNVVAVMVDSVNTADFRFTGCEFYFGVLHWKNCSGITFDACTFGSVTLRSEGCLQCWVTSPVFYTAPVIEANYNGSASELIITDVQAQLSRGGTSVVPRSSNLRLNGGYSSVRKTGANQSIPSSSLNNVVEFNTVLFNAIPGNLSYSLKNFYDITNNWWDMTAVISPSRSFYVWANIQVSVGLTGTFDPTKVDVFLRDGVSSRKHGYFTRSSVQGSSVQYCIYSWAGPVEAGSSIQVCVDNGLSTPISVYVDNGTEAVPCRGIVHGI